LITTTKPGDLHTRRRAFAVRCNDAPRRSEKCVASRYTRTEKVRRRHEIRASERWVATTVRVTRKQQEIPMFPHTRRSRDVLGLRLAPLLVPLASACAAQAKPGPPTLQGLVSLADGESFTLIRGTSLDPAPKGVTLTAGDMIETGPGAFLALEMTGGN